MASMINYYGVNLPVMPEGQVALGAMVCIKVLNEDGVTVYKEYKSPELHSVEGLGMAHTLVNSLEKACMAGAQSRPE